MTRYMYDAISANVGALKALNPEMLAIYLTGSSDIRWTTADVEQFPNVKTWVRIDQGGPTSPQYAATVFDVEPGAWSVHNAQMALEKSTAPRPTIYCDQSDWKTVTADCAIWLAAPGLSDQQAITLASQDKRIVAVQNVWAKTYDRSIVIDPNWPNKAVVAAGLPTNVEFSEFPVTSQINAKCDPVDGPHPEFEWQLEILGVKGWTLVSQINTTGPLVSFKGLGSKQHYRFRVTRGTWSEWVNVNT